MMVDVTEKGIRSLQADMQAGILSSEGLTLAYLQRIGELDRAGPAYHAIAEINPDALFQAQALDRERRMAGPRGPLHGIPVLVKDNIATRDKMHTTAGSVALCDNFAREDAFLVQRLRQAGAVLLGKANLSEFARYMATDTRNGYSSRGGQVLNPYHPDHDVSGSSSGSAVAASVSFCAVAIGTETDGSIVAPSSANGIVGLKPTVGLISRSGILPICSQDTAGPMGRTVEDVAITLGCLVGEDPEDPATGSTAPLSYSDYTAFLDRDALRDLRIGVNRGHRSFYTDSQMALFEAAVADLKAAGATVIDGCDLDNVYDRRTFPERAVMVYEFKQALNAYLARYGGLPDRRTLHDIVRYNADHPEIALKYGQDVLERSDLQTSGRLVERQYLLEKVRIHNLAGPEGIDRQLREHDVDLLCCPGPTDLAPISGYPILNVPAGVGDDGVAFGISFYAGAFSEPMLLAAGYSYEQHSHKRVIPTP